MRSILENIADKPLRRIVGLMSGTSVDGIDAAFVEIEGRSPIKVKLCAFINQPFPSEIRECIFSLFDTQNATVDRVGEMNVLLGELFAEASLAVIKKAGHKPGEVDLIGSHGQTIYHSPDYVKRFGREIHYTVQIGEGAVIAERTGIPCISDFRVADMAAGGMGAPLVPFTEYLLYRNSAKSILLQNIGGIGNMTVLPAGCGPADVFAFDTGPGNMIIDALVQRLYTGKLRMDVGGSIARNGRIDSGLLALMKNEPYFQRRPPKTTGRELFGDIYLTRVLLPYIEQKHVKREDAVATATYFTAWSIADAYHHFVQCRCQADQMIVGGGGSYNAELMRYLYNEMSVFGIETSTQEDYGLHSDAKEAIAFAILADCTAAGIANTLPRVTGARHPAVTGKVSL